VQFCAAFVWLPADTYTPKVTSLAAFRKQGEDFVAETFDFETANFMRHGPSRKNVVRIAVVIIALLFLFFLSPFGTIAAGERGVHLRFTAVTGKVFGEGLYFRFPLIESVQLMDVKVQKYEMKSDAASKDLQTVHSVVALDGEVHRRRTDHQAGNGAG